MLSFVLFCLIYYTLLWLFDQHKPSPEFCQARQFYNKIRINAQGVNPEDTMKLIHDSPAPLHTAA